MVSLGLDPNYMQSGIMAAALRTDSTAYLVVQGKISLYECHHHPPPLMGPLDLHGPGELCEARASLTITIVGLPFIHPRNSEAIPESVQGGRGPRGHLLAPETVVLHS